MTKDEIIKRLAELKAKTDLTDAEKEEAKKLVTMLKHSKGKENRKGSNKGKGRGSNDVAWWDRYPELTAGAINLPFNYIPGTTISGTNNSGARLPATIGHVARVGYIPTIGSSLSDGDAFNAQMRQLWLDMHRKYRGIGTYEKSDLGIVIYSILSAFVTLAKFERIYGVINTYKVMNRNVPYTLKEALGIDNLIESDLANLRYQLNFRISKLSQLCLPKGMSIFEAEVVLNSFIFKDSENPRASLFMYDPDIFYIYDATTLSNGGCVKSCRFSDYQNGTTPGSNPGFTVSDILQILDLQIDSLLADDDVARMCSDLIAAYGEQSLTTVGYLPEDYKVEAIFDYERLLQFHNLTIMGDQCTAFHQGGSSDVSAADAANFYANHNYIVIYQRDNVIMNELMHCNYAQSDGYANAASSYYGIPITGATAVATTDILLDFWKDQPDKADIMCGSRFTALAAPSYTFNSLAWQFMETFGSEVVTSLTVYCKVGATYTIQPFTSSSISYNTYLIQQLALLLSFDWHPIFYIATTTDFRIFADVDNFTNINYQNLGRIHDVALYSAFKLPMGSKSE